MEQKKHNCSRRQSGRTAGYNCCSPEELILMTEDELNDYKKTEQGQSIGSIKIKDSIKGVYSITGVKVADELNETLPKGIYIVNGKKIIRQ